MKILHLTNNYPTESFPIFGIFVKEQIDSLSKQNLKNDVLFINGREKGKLEYIKSIFNIRKKLSNEKYDVIHCHNYSLSKIIIKYFLKKTILTVHGFNRPITNRNKYKFIIAISKAIKVDLKMKGVMNVKLVENGILSEKILQKEKFNTTIRIVCIGRLVHEIKGQDILIKAFANLRKKRNNIKLHFIGDGPSVNYLMNLSSKLNIKEDIFFHGLKSRSELYKSLKNFDIVVQPSHHEGFGLAAVEAMVAKIPLLISSATGLLEVTNNGVLGTVSKGNDYQEYELNLEKIVKRIKKQDFELEHQLQMARVFALKNFSIDNTCKEYLKIYNQLK